jgi:hypothetical protein
VTCACATPCTFTEVPLEEISVQWDGPAVGKKAQAFPKSKAIFIDRAFWRAIPTVAGRAGLLAHERGHIEGAKCEPCADRRAGEILKREGWPTARDAQAAALANLENRSPEKAAEAMGQGFGADGFLQNRERSEGTVDELQAFLDVVAHGGVQYAGRTWSVMVGIEGGRRTDAEQLELFKKGRAQQPDGSWVVVDHNKVVTNVRSAAAGGKHGKGEAVDLWIVGVDGQPLLYPKDYARAGLASMRDFDGVYAALGQVGKNVGLRWGGDWGRTWSNLDELLELQTKLSAHRPPALRNAEPGHARVSSPR